MKPIGFVYLLGNEWMPSVYKVGCTERAPHLRAAELSDATGVPGPFKVLCYIEVESFQTVERELHERLTEYRINSGREFFQLESLPELIGTFRWYPFRLAFCDVGATDMLRQEYGGPDASERSLDDLVTDPWAEPTVDRTDDFPDFDMPWEGPALKVVPGGSQ